MTSLRVTSIAIDCKNPEALCQFYATLLDLPTENTGIMIGKTVAGEGFELWFQPVEDYQAPSWPTQERGQQAHLDMHTDDRDAMVARALELGATLPDQEPADSFTVMLDPEGHPFCICDEKDE